MRAASTLLGHVVLTAALAAPLCLAETVPAAADPAAPLTPFTTSITCLASAPDKTQNPFTCSAFVATPKPVVIDFVSTSCGISGAVTVVTPPVFMGVFRIELAVGSVGNGNTTYELNAGAGPSTGDSVFASQVKIGQRIGTFYGTSQLVRIFAGAGATLTATVNGSSVGITAGGVTGGNVQCTVVLSGQAVPNNF
ncbi:MAG TPA: hypothetical protein VH249_09345 [Xanthobacteraceae bacterium]|jgi:hypothetical protein|nr:hypothetical protein [Xanthobacteraceae bacterium]